MRYKNSKKRYYCNKKFDQSKYGQVLRREGSKIDKLAGKQLSEKLFLLQLM